MSLPGSSLSHSVSGWPCRSFLLSSCCRCWVCVVAPGCLGYCFLPLDEGGRPVAPLPTLSLCPVRWHLWLSGFTVQCSFVPWQHPHHRGQRRCAAVRPWRQPVCLRGLPSSHFSFCFPTPVWCVQSATGLQLVCTKVLQARRWQKKKQFGLR